jgi:hypothetical protein
MKLSLSAIEELLRAKMLYLTVSTTTTTTTTTTNNNNNNNSILLNLIHVYQRAESTARWPIQKQHKIQTQITKDNQQDTHKTNTY